MVKSLARHVAWLGLKLLARCHLHALLVPIFGRVIRELDAEGNLHPVNPDGGAGKFTVLALSCEYYRKDPQVLAGMPGVRVLAMPQRWQTRLIFQFYDQGFHWFQYMNPPAGSVLVQQKVKLRNFLRGFLPRLYRRLGVDCVIAPHIHFYPDGDWGAVSHEVGYPFVVLQRENMVLAKYLREHVSWRVKHIGHFEGTKVIVHNRHMRELYLDAGIVQPKQIEALGCIRMDSFVAKAKQAAPPHNARKRIVYFPFYLGTTFDEPIRPFFNAAHVALVEFTAEHPDVDVLIKPKEKFYPKWRDDFDQAMALAGLSPEKIRNLTIRCEGDAQEIIMQADVVSGLQTTTLLEAALAGRPVVIPYFKEMDDPEYDARTMFRESFDHFDVARDAAEYKRQLHWRLSHSTLEPEKREAIADVFSNFVSDVNGGATERYVTALQSARSGAGTRKGNAAALGVAPRSA